MSNDSGGLAAPDAQGPAPICLPRGCAPTFVFSAQDEKGNPYIPTGLFILWAPLGIKNPAPPNAGASPSQKHSSLEGCGAISIGFVDGKGFLQNVYEDTNPWSAVAPQKEKGAPSRQTESQKLCEGQAYRLWLVAHPHPNRATALAAFLTKGVKDPALDTDGSADGRDAPTPFEIKIERVTQGKAVSFPVRLPADATSYWPPGSSRYGGWLLFRDMPHAPLVREQVRKLVADLMSLRYPVGSGTSPYKDDKPPGWFGDAVMGAVDGFQRSVISRRARRMATTGPVAIESKTNTSFERLADIEIALSATKTDPAAIACSALFDETQIFPAVVGHRTASAIEEWLAKGLRHPGDVFVIYDAGTPPTWTRPQTVLALWAWDVLVRALGCPYGIQVGSSFRPFNTKPGPGQSAVSFHATGHATDLACSFDEDYTDVKSERTPRFPVAFEARWFLAQGSPEAKLAGAADDLRQAHEQYQQSGLPDDSAEADRQLAARRADAEALPRGSTARIHALADLKTLEAKAAKLKAARENLNKRQKAVDELPESVVARRLDYRLQHCMYGHSTLPAYRPMTAAELAAAKATGTAPADGFAVMSAADLQNEMRERFGGPGPSGDFALVAAYEKKLRAIIPDRPDLIATWVTPFVSRLHDAVEALWKACDARADESETALQREYFRRTVQPFENDAWSLSGGRSQSAISAPDDARDPRVCAGKWGHPNLPGTARCWLNLSRLARLVDLHRISARNSDFKLKLGNPLVKEKEMTRDRKIEGRLLFYPKPIIETGRRKGTPEEIATARKAVIEGDPYDDKTRRGALRRLALALRTVAARTPDFVIHGTFINDAGGKATKETKEFKAGDVSAEHLSFMESWPPPAFAPEDWPPGITFEGFDLEITVSGDREIRKAQVRFVTDAIEGSPNIIVVAARLGMSMEWNKGEPTVGHSLRTDDFSTMLQGIAFTSGPSKAGGDAGTPLSSKRKSSADQMVRVRPDFLSRGTNLWNATLELPEPGTPKGLEWWHLEHASRLSQNKGEGWPLQMETLGISARALEAPSDPKEFGVFVVRGPGYKPNGGNYDLPGDPGNAPAFAGIEDEQ